MDGVVIRRLDMGRFVGPGKVYVFSCNMQVLVTCMFKYVMRI